MATDGNKTLQVVSEIKTKSTQILHNLDVEIYSQIQNFIDKLYSGKYGKIFSYSIFDVPVANLIVGAVIFLFFLLLRRLFTNILVKYLMKVASRTKNIFDDIIIQEIYKPIEFLFIVLGLHLFLKLTFSHGETSVIVHILLVFDLYWVLYAITPTIKEILFHISKKENMMSFELSNFIVKIVRILIIISAILNILYLIGINITTFLASIGLGGLAFALAAKDTASNLFGSIAILVDESIKIGEWIKVADVEGFVEDIGMRTTKIRAFDKSIKIIPNSIVATSAITNYSRRGIRRIKMSIGITYDTTPEQLEDILNSIRVMLSTHSGIAKGDIPSMVYFTEFADSSLNILIYTFANSSVWDEYLKIRESVNIEIMKIIKKHNASFAFPSQSVYVEQLPNENK